MTPPSPAAAAAEQAHRSLVPQRSRPTTSRPRRVSGPARRVPAPSPDRGDLLRRRPSPVTLAARLEALVDRLSEHRLLDRLISGKLWIGLVAFALIGIVTLQLLLLQLNSSIGRSLVRETALERGNASLSVENSTMAAGDLIQSRASTIGMVPVASSAIRFLSVTPGDLTRALRSLTVPVTSQAPSSTSGEPAGGEGSTETAAGESGAAAAAGSATSAEGAASTEGAASSTEGAASSGEGGASSGEGGASSPEGTAGTGEGGSSSGEGTSTGATGSGGTTSAGGG